MNFVDVTAQELAEARAEAEALMVSTVVVRRKTGYMTQHEDSGLEVPGWVEVYTGKFKLGGSNQGSSPFRARRPGDVTVESSVRVGHFPAGTADLADGDLIDITVGETAGLVFRIVEADWKDLATARRVPIEATQRPPEW